MHTIGDALLISKTGIEVVALSEIFAKALVAKNCAL